MSKWRPTNKSKQPYDLCWVKPSVQFFKSNTSETSFVFRNVKKSYSIKIFNSFSRKVPKSHFSNFVRSAAVIVSEKPALNRNFTPKFHPKRNKIQMKFFLTRVGIRSKRVEALNHKSWSPAATAAAAQHSTATGELWGLGGGEIYSPNSMTAST